ncbi:GspE/PulE family protein [Clostridium sp. CM028]|uniref:GspE/PulE family protein n=1 Tax=unclassified Clostridium TaxID=2614128 RepID=UPI001C6E9B4C|nr:MULTISPECIES: GspE/PulE family protein [unclassified Clostridium]MBW9144437.1 GspE/PulE family protein [Clostridium sp. CM027]MBW9149327.1 GspE/PulE family protein [Clostridium sp. CM028]UVE40938.1 GspE/PulE family protein [Clostridium sp. CM027]WLC61606.1 GspE/PulE family protein [Clostridium sp. CM028]
MSLQNKQKLGYILVQTKKITEEQLKSVLKKQRISGKRLGEQLIEDNILTEDVIIDVLEIQLGIMRVDLERTVVNMEAVKCISESLALRYNLIPIDIEDNKIKVAMADPLNVFAIDDVGISSGYEVEPLITTQTAIKKSIDRYYSSQYVQKAANELVKSQTQSDIKGLSVEESDSLENIKNAPAVRLVDSLVKNAVKSRASDIHIEPFDEYVRVRYRIDGELHEVLKSPKETLAALVTRIKILGNMNIAEKRLPQDGRILMNIEKKDYDLRVSILPTVYGEKVVIRVLDRENFLKSKKQLGLSKDDLEKVEGIIKSPYGIILVTGPTGSGKSTTLYSILSDLNKENTNIITVEDPVEYLIDDINQVNVNIKAGLTFASGLRSILRQDPDIIMIGEIRDSETAEIAIRSAITGHLVLSTIHTNDAASAVVRLSDMGIEPYLVATSVSGVISQRLVRRICKHCKTSFEASSYEKTILGLEEQETLKLYKGEGCTYCNNSGFSGRTGVYEIMEITREIRESILLNKSIDQIKDISIRNGMKTLKKSCEELVYSGETTIDELIKIAFSKDS